MVPPFSRTFGSNGGDNGKVCSGIMRLMKATMMIKSKSIQTTTSSSRTRQLLVLTVKSLSLFPIATTTAGTGGTSLSHPSLSSSPSVAFLSSPSSSSSSSSSSTTTTKFMIPEGSSSSLSSSRTTIPKFDSPYLHHPKATVFPSSPFWNDSLRKKPNRLEERPSASRRFSSSSSSSHDESITIKTTETETQMKHDAIDIINSAIEAVDPYNAIRSFVHRQHNLLTIGRYSTNNVGKGDGMSKGIQQSSSSPPSSSSSTSAQPGLRTYDLSKDYDSVVLVAFGKASSAMATSFVQELLQINDEERASSSSSSDDISLSLSGVVICKDGHATPQELEILNSYAPGIKIMNASHPVPDDRSVDGATMLLDHVRMTSNPRCLVVCCISGGGSALFCSPRPPLTLGDLQIVNRVLLASGMSITEMNVIRKRLENGKGGRLATACYPSTVVTLVLSDVLGDPLDLIASGPTVPDTSTGNDAWRIVQEYNLVGKLPSSVESVLQQIVQEEEERMKASNIRPQHGSDHPVFETSQTVLVGNNPRAVEAAALKAKILGYHPVILGTEMDGEAKEIANFYVAMAKHLKLSSRNNNMKNAFSVAPGLPVALIAGGETTVTLHPDDNHNGKGGRNQELALSAAIQLETSNLRNVVIASAGTDGGDGPTDAAGAVVDACTIRGSRHDALVALGGHNAYPYLDRLGAELISDSTAKSQPPPPLIKTGPTGTNVADVCVTLIKDD